MKIISINSVYKFLLNKDIANNISLWNPRNFLEMLQSQKHSTLLQIITT